MIKIYICNKIYSFFSESFNMIPELITRFYETKSVSKEQYESLQPLKKPYGKKLGDFLVDNGYLTRNDLKTFLEENKDFLFELLDKWLNDNPKIANAIDWKNSSKEGSNAYSKWPGSKKMELSCAFWNVLLNVQPGLPEVPPSTVKLDENGKVFSTDLKVEDAWKYYLAYLSQCLTVEIAKLVQWSIFKYNETQLGLLLDSRSLFEYIESEDDYSILSKSDSPFNHGSTMPGDPTRIYDFLSNQELIGITRIDTIGRILGWCRGNLYKVNADTPQNYREYWNYEGYPPVEMIISGTEHPKLGFQHFTAGCWVTSGFISMVLKTINIPASLEERCGHALPLFLYNNHKFYLSHGDDPYSKLYKNTRFPFPPRDLLIDQHKFEQWFNQDLPEETVCNNVGRHVFELTLEYLPDEILKIYCEDDANGKTPENGRVFNEIFKNHISLSELKSYGLWDRLKKKAEESGGCKNISSG